MNFFLAHVDFLFNLVKRGFYFPYRKVYSSFEFLNSDCLVRVKRKAASDLGLLSRMCSPCQPTHRPQAQNRTEPD